MTGGIPILGHLHLARHRWYKAFGVLLVLIFFAGVSRCSGKNGRRMLWVCTSPCIWITVEHLENPLDISIISWYFRRVNPESGQSCHCVGEWGHYPLRCPHHKSGEIMMSYHNLVAKLSKKWMAMRMKIHRTCPSNEILNKPTVNWREHFGAKDKFLYSVCYWVSQAHDNLTVWRKWWWVKTLSTS